MGYECPHYTSQSEIPQTFMTAAGVLTMLLAPTTVNSCSHLRLKVSKGREGSVQSFLQNQAGPNNLKRLFQFPSVLSYIALNYSFFLSVYFYFF